MKSPKPFRFHKSKPLEPKRLPEIYRTLLKNFGHQKWWPGDTAFEIIIGAILTQNTNWANVEKAIRNLKRAGKLTPEALRKIPRRRLAALIRPSGYFNLKADRLKHFIDFLFEEYGGQLKQMFREDGEALRHKLLAVKGIGPETADSILLYAAGKSFFVMDAYTKRIFSRHRLKVIQNLKKLPLHLEGMEYHDWQKVFAEHMPASLYNDFHAQIVMLGKTYCHKSQPDCTHCPIHHRN
jgi:endonuclease-3 related protein